MIITSFRSHTTKKLIKEKRLSKSDVMILIEHLCILNNKKMEKDGKKNLVNKFGKELFENFRLYW